MTIVRYEKALRDAIRGFWNGSFDEAQFHEAVRGAANRWLQNAWESGAETCGILPDELTNEEQVLLSQRILGEINRIPTLTEYLFSRTKAKGGKLNDVLFKASLWSKRYLDLKNEAVVSACSNEKLVWALGATEEHCKTCNRLNGKVKRGSVWASNEIFPQRPPNVKLECGGYNCKCELKPTTERASPGKLPKVP